MSLLRPNTVQVIRKGGGAKTNSGGTVPTMTPIYTTLPCLVDMNVVTQGRMMQSSTGGPVIESTHVLYADGSKVSGYTPGTHVTIRGIDMIVCGNARGAFPDIRRNDKIIDERGRSFLVLNDPSMYYDIFPNIQVELAEGKEPS